jgi:predicted neuraminidase
MSSFVLPSQPAETAFARQTSVLVAPASGVAHAASAVLRADGSMVAVWFQGRREAEANVAIRGQVIGEAESFFITDGAMTGRGLGHAVRTVGNPVIFRHPDGGYGLLHPSVTLGGWAGACLNLLRSDDGCRFGPPKRLTASPFFNLSNIVKAPPIALDDGTLALPAYHECMGGFGEMLFVNADGDVTDKARMGAFLRTAIQPWPVVLDDKRAVAFCRSLGKSTNRIFRTETRDAGRHWSKIETLDLPNPDSAVAATQLPEGRIGLVFNDHERDRYTLNLAVSDDEGRNFRRCGVLFDGRSRRETHRYPFLMVDGEGRLNLFHTARRHERHEDPRWQIRHSVFGIDVFEGGEGELVFDL